MRKCKFACQPLSRRYEDCTRFRAADSAFLCAHSRRPQPLRSRRPQPARLRSRRPRRRRYHPSIIVSMNCRVVLLQCVSSVLPRSRPVAEPAAADNLSDRTRALQ